MTHKNFHDHSKKCFIMFLISILLVPMIIGAQQFPLRTKFPTTKPISTKELAAEFGKGIVIVDVRSDVEFDVIHIKNAVHVIWGQMNFGKDLEKAVKSNKETKIAFYCNGVNCAKSYHASEEAVKLGYRNTYVYDAGVLEWAQTYPDKAFLLGKTPVNKSQLISTGAFESRLLAKDEFLKKAADASSLVIDIRDPAQRKQNPNVGRQIMLTPMDKMVNTLSEPLFKESSKDKTLYFFDAVGKQVEWLQYYLNKNGYKNYFFLKGGVASIFGNEG